MNKDKKFGPLNTFQVTSRTPYAFK